jgi:hypothetical protein
MFLCRGSPTRGMTTGTRAVRLPTSRAATHQRHRHADRRATTTDALTRARTPMLTLHHFSRGRLRTLPPPPCCCAAARSLQPPRSDGCASSCRRLLTVKIRQPSHEFTFGVGISFIPYPLVLTPVV